MVRESGRGSADRSRLFRSMNAFHSRVALGAEARSILAIFSVVRMAECLLSAAWKLLITAPWRRLIVWGVGEAEVKSGGIGTGKMERNGTKWNGFGDFPNRTDARMSAPGSPEKALFGAGSMAGQWVRLFLAVFCSPTSERVSNRHWLRTPLTLTNYRAT